MDESMVLPSVGGKGSEIKEANVLVDKVYSPFLSKFMGASGYISKAIGDMQTALTTQLARMIEVLGSLLDKTNEDSDENKKNKPKPDKKKQNEETDKRWYNIVKGKWFEKAAGFLSKLVSVNFITMLLGFIIMLRMGLLQMVLPWLLEIVGGAIVSIIKAIPALLKFFFNLLWVTIPKLLKQIFREIFKALGIENKALLAFGDMIAQVLPLLAAIGFIWFKIGPTVTSTITALSKLGPWLTKLPLLGTIFTKLGVAIAGFGTALKTTMMTSILPVIGSFLLAALPFIAIGAALVALFVYAEKISDFFDGLIERFKQMSTMGKVLVGALALIAFPITGIIGLVYGLVKAFKFFKAEGFLGGLKKIWTSIKDTFNSITEYIGNLLAPFVAKLQPVIDLFKWLGNAIGQFVDEIKVALLPMFIEIKDGFTQLYHEVIKPIVNLISKVFSDLYTEAIKPVMDMIVNAFNSFMSTVSPILKWVGDKFTEMWNIIKPIVTWISEAIGSFLMVPINLISKFMPQIKSVFGFILDVLKVIIIGIFKVIKFIVLLPLYIYQGVVSAIDWISSAWSGMVSWMSGLWEGLGLKLKSIRETIGGVFNKIGGFFSNLFSPLFEKVQMIKDYFSNLFSDLPEFSFSTIVDGLYNSVVNVFTRMVNFIGGIPQMFVSAIKGISKAMSRFTNWFVGLLRGMLDSFLSPFKSIFTGLGKITKPVMDAIAPLLNSISSFMGNIGNTLGRMFDKVKSAFDNIMNYLGNIIEFGPEWFLFDDTEKAKVAQVDKALSTEGGQLIQKIAKGEVAANAAGVSDVLTPEAIKLATDYREYAKGKKDPDSFKKWVAEKSIDTKEGVQNRYTDFSTKSFKQGEAATAALNKYGI